MRTEALARIVLLLALAAAPVVAHAEEAEGQKLLAADNDIRNRASLQRGARNFMNYCSGCHSAQFVRYNRIAADLEIAPEDLQPNLMFTSIKPADTIKSALRPEDGRNWFGNAPPDLSLIARARSSNYLYTYLKSFYADPTRPHGVNNLALPGTAMPNVFAELQATLPEDKFNEVVRDTVNFLQYIGEPIEVQRRDLGVWVLLFVGWFTVLAYLLYKNYWKDVH